jgi:hypothetical protein
MVRSGNTKISAFFGAGAFFSPRLIKKDWHEEGGDCEPGLPLGKRSGFNKIPDLGMEPKHRIKTPVEQFASHCVFSVKNVVIQL